MVASAAKMLFMLMLIALRPTKIINAIKEIDLLLINDGDKWHYVVIKNLNRLLGSQCNKHKCKTYFCRTCFHGFGSEELLKKSYR